LVMPSCSRNSMIVVFKTGAPPKSVAGPASRGPRPCYVSAVESRRYFDMFDNNYQI
jgi:hypothetical protein